MNQLDKEVAFCLFRFQLIEEALKRYIGNVDLLIAEGMKAVVHCEPADVQNAPLEKLIPQFGRRTARKDLVEKLYELRNDRNYVAHRAYLFAVKEVQITQEDVLQRLRDIREKVDPCLDAVIEEGKVMHQKLQQLLTGSV